VDISIQHADFEPFSCESHRQIGSDGTLADATFAAYDCQLVFDLVHLGSEALILLVQAFLPVCTSVGLSTRVAFSIALCHMEMLRHSG
jgi:hypothetical protein